MKNKKEIKKEKYTCPRCEREMEARPTELVCPYCGLKAEYEEPPLKDEK